MEPMTQAQYFAMAKNEKWGENTKICYRTLTGDNQEKTGKKQIRNAERISYLVKFINQQFQQNDVKVLHQYDIVGLILSMLKEGDAGKRGLFGSRKSGQISGKISEDLQKKVESCQSVIRSIANIFAAHHLNSKPTRDGLSNTYQLLEKELEESIRLLKTNNKRNFEGVEKLIQFATETLNGLHKKNIEIAKARSRASDNLGFRGQVILAKKFGSYLSEDDNKLFADKMVFGKYLHELKQEVKAGNFDEKRLNEIEDILETHRNVYWYTDAFDQLQRVKIGRDFALARFHKKMGEVEQLLSAGEKLKEAAEKESINELLHKAKIVSELLKLADPSILSILKDEDLQRLYKIKDDYSHLIHKTIERFINELDTSRLLLDKRAWDEFNKQYKDISECVHVYKIKENEQSAELNKHYIDLQAIKKHLSFLNDLHSLPRQIYDFPKDNMMLLLKCYRYCLNFKNQIEFSKKQHFKAKANEKFLEDPLFQAKFNEKFLEQLGEMIESDEEDSFNLKDAIDQTLFQSQNFTSIQRKIDSGEKQRAELDVKGNVDSFIQELNLHMSEIESYLNVFPLNERVNKSELGYKLSLVSDRYKKLKILYEINTQLKAIKNTGNKDEKSNFRQLAKAILNSIFPSGNVNFEETGNKGFDAFILANFKALHASITTNIGKDSIFGNPLKKFSASNIPPKILLGCGPELINVITDFFQYDVNKKEQLLRIAKIKSIPYPGSPEFNELPLNHDFFEVLKAAHEYVEEEAKFNEQGALAKLIGSSDSFVSKQISEKARALVSIASEGICALMTDPTVFQMLKDERNEEIPAIIVKLKALVNRAQDVSSSDKYSLVNQYILRLEYAHMMNKINKEIKDAVQQDHPNLSPIIKKMPEIEKTLSEYEVGFGLHPLAIDEHLHLNLKEEVFKHQIEGVYQALSHIDLNVMKKKRDALRNQEKDVKAFEFLLSELRKKNTQNASEEEVKKIALEIEKVEKDLSSTRKELDRLRSYPTELEFVENILKNLEDDEVKSKIEKEKHKKPIDPQLMLFTGYCREIIISMEHICDCVDNLIEKQQSEKDIDTDFQLYSKNLSILLQDGKPLFNQLGLALPEFGSVVHKFYGDEKLKYKMAEFESLFESNLNKLVELIQSPDEEEDLDEVFSDIFGNIYEKLKENRTNKSQPEEVTKEVEGMLSGLLSNIKEIRKVLMLNPSRYNGPVKTSIKKIDDAIDKIFAQVKIVHQRFNKEHMAYNVARNRIAVLNDRIQTFSKGIPVEVYDKISPELQRFRQKLFTLDHILPRLKNPINSQKAQQDEKMMNAWLAELESGFDEIAKIKKVGKTRSLSISGNRQVFFYDTMAEKIFDIMNDLEVSLNEKKKEKIYNHYVEAYELYKKIVADSDIKKNFNQGFPNLWDPFEEIINKTAKQIYYNFSKPKSQELIQMNIRAPVDTSVDMEAFLKGSQADESNIEFWKSNPEEAYKSFLETFNKSIKANFDIIAIKKQKEIIRKIYHEREINWDKFPKIRNQLRIIYSNIEFFELIWPENIDTLPYDPNKLGVDPSEQLLFTIDNLISEKRHNLNMDDLQDDGLKAFFVKGIGEYASVHAKNEVAFRNLFEEMINNRSPNTMHSAIDNFETSIRNSKPFIYSDLIKAYTLRFFNHYMNLVNEYERSLEQLRKISNRQEFDSFMIVLNELEDLLYKFESSMDDFIDKMGRRQDRSTLSVRELLPAISKHLHDFRVISSNIQEQINVFTEELSKSSEPFDLDRLKKIPVELKDQMLQNLEEVQILLNEGLEKMGERGRVHLRQVTEVASSALDAASGFAKRAIRRVEEMGVKAIELVDDGVHKGKVASAKELHEFLINQLIKNLDVPSAAALNGGRIPQSQLISSFPALIETMDEDLKELFGLDGIDRLLKVEESDEKEVESINPESESETKRSKERNELLIRLSKDIDMIKVMNNRIKKIWPEGSPKTSHSLNDINNQVRYCSRFLNALRTRRKFQSITSDPDLIEGIIEKRKKDAESLSNLEKLIMVFQEL